MRTSRQLPADRLNNNDERQEIPSVLSSLSPKLREQVIYIPSPLSVLGLLAQTSKQYEANTAFLRLLAASIHAAPAYLDNTEDATALAALPYLKRHPELLFKEKKIIDHYGREILASPYKIFLGTRDIWALRRIIKDILPLIENGEMQEEAQFKKQFPNCPWPVPQNVTEEMLYDDRNTCQIEEIVKQLAIVKQCMDVDPFNNGNPLNVTQQAVDTLCKLFQPTPGEIIQSGLHFPLAIIQEIYKIYNTLQKHYSFFSLAVIKPALDALSTVHAQCCQGGLNGFDMEKGPNRRCDPSFQHPLGKPLSLQLINDQKKCEAAIVDPYDGDISFASSLPQSEFFDWYKKNAQRPYPGAVRQGAPLHANMLEIWKAYGEQMQRLMGAIMQSSERPTHHLGHRDHSMRCVIL